MNGHRGTGAMPEGHNAIRIQFEEDEPPALAFHAQALPGALASWAWHQLVTLDALLDALIVTRQGRHGDTDLASAVQALIVPVINALSFSEQRAHELRFESSPARIPRGKKGRIQRKSKAAED